MRDDELNKAKAFLNKKELPTSDDILNLFFFETKNEMNESKIEMDPNKIDFETLGEADEVRTEKGSEWIVTRLLWNTEDGRICKINLIKIGEEFVDENDIFSMNPFYNSNDKETIDIEYEDLGKVDEISYQDLLDSAIDNEDFEEAARLRDWDLELRNLLLSLKPKILKALKEEDVKKLDELLTQIRVYRSTL